MLTLRKATARDSDLLYEWRNDPITRRSSHDTSEIARERHERWLAASLENSRRQIFIAEEHERLVGTVRVDHGPDGTAELSWTVAPDARGKGVATRMVRRVADEISGKCPVRAEVKAGNHASVKVANAAGMHLVNEGRDVLHFYRAASPE
ncbi:GNAT family N-acetyltransferase [Caballeronia glebae]|uniref:GNAT family N-acetyltransferase n=1 Tax=Caballeronia glebae TaxID=1777143 RepID=UPI000B35B1DF